MNYSDYYSTTRVTPQDYANWLHRICRDEGKQGFALTINYKNSSSEYAATLGYLDFMRKLFPKVLSGKWKRPGYAKRVLPFTSLCVPGAKYGSATRSHTYGYHTHTILLVDPDLTTRIRRHMDWNDSYQWDELNKETSARNHLLQYLPSLVDVHGATGYATKALPHLDEVSSNAIILPNPDRLLPKTDELIERRFSHQRPSWEFDQTQEDGEVTTIQPDQPTEDENEVPLAA